MNDVFLRARTAWVPVGGCFFVAALFDSSAIFSFFDHLPAIALQFVVGSIFSLVAALLGAKYPLRPDVLRHTSWMPLVPSIFAVGIAAVWSVFPPDINQFIFISRFLIIALGAIIFPYWAASTQRFAVRRARSYFIEYSIWAFIGMAALAMLYWCVKTFVQGSESLAYLNLIPPVSATIAIAGIGWLIATYSKRRDNAIKMTDRLASPEMHVSRRVTSDFLKNVAKLKFVDLATVEKYADTLRSNDLRFPAGRSSLRNDLDKAAKRERKRRLKHGKEVQGSSNNSYEKLSIETHVSSVIAFYELLYSMAREGAIEVNAVRNSFGQRTAWFLVFLYEAYPDDQSSYRFALEKFEHLQLLAKPRQLVGFRKDWQDLRRKALDDLVPPPSGEA